MSILLFNDVNTITLQYSAAEAHNCFSSLEAGCQAGGPLSVNNPIPVSAAFIIATPFP